MFTTTICTNTICPSQGGGDDGGHLLLGEDDGTDFAGLPGGSAGGIDLVSKQVQNAPAGSSTA